VGSFDISFEEMCGQVTKVWDRGRNLEDCSLKMGSKLDEVGFVKVNIVRMIRPLLPHLIAESSLYSVLVLAVGSCHRASHFEA
jgi:hypothetical protein